MQDETLFKAFANSNRRSILRYLKTHGEKSVSDISEILGISIKSASDHLSKLLRAGLVETRKKDRKRFYRINDHLEELHKKIIGQI